MNKADKKLMKLGSMIMQEKKRAFEQEVKTLKEFLFNNQKRKWNFDYTIEVRNGQIKRSIISEVWNGEEYR